ncbi:hypothetical protein H0R92_10840 [Treponema sp. OMZ 840]|uniref:hypothetical protein n=1 Tax=Treponema sp. OMZ 840 TaxID=244313 RepID=UPI003D9040B7
MKMSVEKLKQVNTVFTFVFFILISLFAAGVLVYTAVDFIGGLSRSYERGVDIIENIENADELIYSTEFIGAIKDVYVFAKTGGAVSLGFEKSDVWKATGYNSYSDHSAADEILNFYFVPKYANKSSPLFEQDVMIVFYQFVQEEDGNKNGLYTPLPKNVYIAALRDTDGDKKLTFKDDTALYVSEYDGSSLKKISDSVFGCQASGNTEILFCEYENNRCIYKVYNMDDDTVKTVFTAAGTEPEKNFHRFYRVFN